MNLLEKLGKLRIIPVVKIEHSGQAAALAEAPLKGGLPCAEITFRTHAAEESIPKIVEDQPEMLAEEVVANVKAARQIERIA